MIKKNLVFDVEEVYSYDVKLSTSIEWSINIHIPYAFV